MKLIESLANALKRSISNPCKDVKKIDPSTTLAVNLEDDITTRSMLVKKPTVAYSGASYIYRER